MISWRLPGAWGVLAVFSAAACSKSPAAAEEDPAPEAAVTCAPAAKRSIAETILLRGVVAPPPRADAVLSSTIAGRVSHLDVEVGELVTAGQIVARVDDPALAAGTGEGKAAIAAAEAAVTSAEASRARLQKLVDEGIASRSALEDATARALTAKAELAAARARSGAASGQAARADLRAPRAGTVLRIFRRSGEAVDGTPATPILEVADISVLELRADATAADLVRLAAGATATIVFDALPGVGAAGTVTGVAPAVDSATALGQVRIALAPASPGVRMVVGLTGTATVALTAHDAVVVPLTALRRGATGADEVVACEGAKAAIKPVTIGIRLADVAEIVDGIAAGDRIVIDHALGIADDQPLKEASK